MSTTLDFKDIGKELSFGFSEKERSPVYKGNKVYRDMADNLSKVKFDVIVTEGYVPNVHWSLLGYETEPRERMVYGARGIEAKVKKLTSIPAQPIADPGDNGMNMPCHAKLTGDFIIDALVSGQQLSFKDPNDMDVLADWIDRYLKSYEGLDLTRFPDRKAFNENAKKALGMLRGNILKKEEWNEEVHPAPFTLAEIIANL